jgi:hypothetical protein
MMSVTPRTPAFHEFRLDDALRLGALFQTAGMPLEEFTRYGGKAVQLSPLCVGS